METLIAHPEVHHTVPQYLLRLRDKADAATLDGEGIELWLSFEHEAIRYGVDPDISRTDLSALIKASTWSKFDRSTARTGRIRAQRNRVAGRTPRPVKGQANEQVAR